MVVDVLRMETERLPQDILSATKRVRDHFQKNNLSPPVVVGGVGGSGTRLIARLLREMSVQLGDHVNESEDALHFVSLYDECIPVCLSNRSVDFLVFQENLLAAIQAHRQHFRAGHWGWKNPRSIYLLPLLDQLIPDLRYIHVIRHGFEMASSTNQNQLEKYETYLLNEEQHGLSPELRALSLWDVANQAAADYGLNYMGKRYRLLRHEDVCSDPMDAMQPIAELLETTLPKFWKEAIQPPKERRQNTALETLDKMRLIGATAINRFGYTC
jgi:hypothetical protein